MPLIKYVERKFSAASLDVIARANQILVEYERQGYDLTLRQLYYQFVSRAWIPNRDSEYKKLGSVVNDARLAGLIDWNHITDRTRFIRSVASWDSPAEIIRSAAGGYQRDLWETQDVRFEVWIEKDALVGVIERPCEDLRVPFLSCRGYTSQSEMWRAARRHRYYLDQGKRVVILHLGDHDPSGIDMTRDIEERLSMFIYGHRGTLDGFEVRRIALTWEQIEKYGPPPNPAKLSDSRGASYVERYGYDSWELDALEPTVIGDLIREHVEAGRDPERWDEAVEQEEEERRSLEVASDNWSDVVDFLNS